MQNELYPLSGNAYNIPNDGTEVTINLITENVPSDACEVIVYAYVKTGTGSGDRDGAFRFSTITKQGRIERDLFFHTYSQNAWSYNSENIVLPVGEEKVVHAAIDRATTSPGLACQAKVVGYRKLIVKTL